MKPIPTETATDVGSVGKWLGAAAAGALLMYLLDPERGSARRSRAVSALRAAGARTGGAVDYALHSAGDRLVDLKDSAASVLSRGADRLQTQAAPMIERARYGMQEATQRIEDSASRAKDRGTDYSNDRSYDRGHERSYERAGHETGNGRSLARYNSYESNRQYDAGSHDRGGLAGWLRGFVGGTGNERTGANAPHPALVGSSLYGLLSLMRRSPGGLLVGLAGLALLVQSTRDKTYRVSDNIRDTMLGSKHAGEGGQAQHIPQGEQAGSRYLH